MFTRKYRELSRLRGDQPIGRDVPILGGASNVNFFGSGGYTRNLVTGAKLDIPAAAFLRSFTDGLGWLFDNGTGSYVQNDAWASGVTKDAGTIAILWTPLANSAAQQIVVGFRAGAGGDRYYLVNDAGAVKFGWAGTAFLTTTAAWTAGQADVMILTWTAANSVKCYFRGMEVGSNTSSATANPTTAVVASVASGLESFKAWGAAQSLITLPYGLSAGEAADLTQLMKDASLPDEISWYTQSAGGDTTAPVLTSPTGTQTGSTTGTGGATTDEANGTFYSVASTSSTAPSETQVEAGQMHTGSAAAAAANAAVSSTGAKSVNFTGLTPSTTYYAHSMHKDAAGNQSNVVTSASFTTTAGGGGSTGMPSKVQILFS